MNRALLLAALVLAAGPACSTFKSEMRQAETAYNQANYEDAIRWFVALEPDEPRMKTHERAQYHYLRGMASYRLGKRDDALYYLSLAREIVAYENTTLEGDAIAEMNAAIEDLTPTDAGYHAREEGAGGEVESTDGAIESPDDAVESIDGDQPL
jgi:hypothetical protein